MLEAVTAGRRESRLAMTISCTSGLVIERVSPTAATALSAFSAENLESPGTVRVVRRDC